VFRATNTFTFGAGKPGLYTGLGVEVSGMVETVHLGAQLPVVIGSGTTHLVTAATLSARPHDVHKGDNGRVVIVGGSAGMTGAAVLAARAAHRAGAGLVQIATRAPERIDPKIVEATSIALAAAPADAAREVGELLAKADAAVVGPGLGRDDWGRAVLEAACASAKRLVLDADALTLLAAHGNPSGEAARVLTPHPLEMARLLGHSDADAINVDRLAAARACASKFAATVVLKGAGTVVATREGACWILPFAEAALAVGGSGDVLSGALGARLAERRPGAELLDATLEATVAHARAGSIARRARGGASRGLLAHEIADALSAALEGAD
jgi:NAD(P)H-hydrate epimerase